MTSRLLVDKIEGKSTSGTIQMPAGHIIQTLSSTKLSSQEISVSSLTMVDISDLSVSITPKFSSSKVLVTVHVYVSYLYQGLLRLMRDSTRIPNNTQGQSESYRGFAPLRQGYSGEGYMYSFTFLDSPSTTSATTYKVQGTNNGDTTNTLYINRLGQNANYSGTSSITVQEIAG